MNIFNFRKTKTAYIIHKTSAGVYKLCRVLNEYDSVNEVNIDLCELLTSKKTEKQLLKEYSKKPII